jgi:hypothetical protein
MYIHLHPFALIYFLIPISYFLLISSAPLSENTCIKLAVIQPDAEQRRFGWGYKG